jgi:hypothetical protein
MEGLGSLRAVVDTMEERKISCLYRKSNLDFSVIQPVSSLKYPGSPKIINLHRFIFRLTIMEYQINVTFLLLFNPCFSTQSDSILILSLLLHKCLSRTDFLNDIKPWTQQCEPKHLVSTMTIGALDELVMCFSPHEVIWLPILVSVI